MIGRKLNGAKLEKEYISFHAFVKMESKVAIVSSLLENRMAIWNPESRLNFGKKNDRSERGFKKFQDESRTESDVDVWIKSESF